MSLEIYVIKDVSQNMFKIFVFLLHLFALEM